MLPVPSNPPRATLSGTIANIGAGLMPNHARAAQVGFTQSDTAGGGANDVGMGSGFCAAAGGGGACNYAVTSRIGPVSLVAAVYDIEMGNYRLYTWATKFGLSVTANMPQTGLALTMIDRASLVASTPTFVASPMGLDRVAAAVGIDIPIDGVSYVNAADKNAPITLPPLSAFPANTTYRMLGVAETAARENGPRSITIVRGQTSTAMAVSQWLAPPATAAVTSTTATWSAITGATLGVVTVPDKLECLVLDGSTSITFPAAIGGPAKVTIGALAGALDPSDFGFDRDVPTIWGVASRPVSLP